MLTILRKTIYLAMLCCFVVPGKVMLSVFLVWVIIIIDLPPAFYEWCKTGEWDRDWSRFNGHEIRKLWCK